MMSLATTAARNNAPQVDAVAFQLTLLAPELVEVILDGNGRDCT